MDLLKAYLATICRICAEKIAGKICDVETVKDIIKYAYKDEDGSNLESDSEETYTTKVCSRCYMQLKRWNNQYQKFLLKKRKNPASSITFTSAVKLQPLVENPLVHLVASCPCKGSDTEHQEEAP